MNTQKRKLELSEETLLQLDEMKVICGGAMETTSQDRLCIPPPPPTGQDRLCTPQRGCPCVMDSLLTAEILTSASSTMLAQANQAPQSVLSLLS